jgi:hypothetical protein
MPSSLAAFLADAGVPIDSVTPREARKMLIHARSEARAEARAEARKAHETRAHPGADEATQNAATFEIKPLSDHANEANQANDASAPK